MKKFFSEFRQFIAKGNVLDLAVGIVMGTAFNAIIKSLVADIIMPLIGLIAKTDITNLYVVLRGSAVYDEVLGTLVLSQDAVLLRYGNFMQSIIDFLIIGFAIFLTIRFLGRIKDRLEKAKAALRKEDKVEVTKEQ